MKFAKLVFPPTKLFNISTTTKIAEGSLYIDQPECVIINADSIGKGVICGSYTTIGTNGKPNEENMRPIIGNHVFIGSRCGIFGLISIGNNVLIESGSIVTKDIPDNVIVSGNPAKIVSLNM